MGLVDLRVRSMQPFAVSGASKPAASRTNTQSFVHKLDGMILVDKFTFIRGTDLREGEPARSHGSRQLTQGLLTLGIGCSIIAWLSRAVV
jgi:hypothetical protein